MSVHEHVFRTYSVDENGDRVRTIQDCACGEWRLSTLAKRVTDDGTPAWGPPGEWWECAGGSAAWRGPVW